MGHNEDNQCVFCALDREFNTCNYNDDLTVTAGGLTIFVAYGEHMSCGHVTDLMVAPSPFREAGFVYFEERFSSKMLLARIKALAYMCILISQELWFVVESGM